MVTSLRATSRSIADYLQIQFETDPDLGAVFAPPGDMRVYLNTPAQMNDQRSGLSVWLYRVVRDENTLNRPPERISSGLTRRVPLPVKLHYLITPFTNIDGDDAQETDYVILGKVLQSFQATPCLTGVDLRDDFAGTDARIFVRLEVLALDEITRIWDALESSYRACLSYEVTVVDVHISNIPERTEPVRLPVPQIGVTVGGG